MKWIYGECIPHQGTPPSFQSDPKDCQEDSPKWPKPSPEPPLIQNELLAKIIDVFVQCAAFGFVVSFSVFLIVSMSHAINDNWEYLNLFLVGMIFYVIGWSLAWLFFHMYRSFYPKPPTAKTHELKENEPLSVYGTDYLGCTPKVKKSEKEELIDEIESRNKEHFRLNKLYDDHMDYLRSLKEDRDFCQYQPPPPPPVASGQAPTCNSPTCQNPKCQLQQTLNKPKYYCDYYTPCEFHRPKRPPRTDDDNWFYRLQKTTDDPSHDIQTYDLLKLHDDRNDHIADRQEWLDAKMKHENPAAWERTLISRKEAQERDRKREAAKRRPPEPEPGPSKRLDQNCGNTQNNESKPHPVDWGFELQKFQEECKKNKEKVKACGKNSKEKFAKKQQPTVDDNQQPCCSKNSKECRISPGLEILKKNPTCDPCRCGQEEKVYTTMDQRGVRYQTIPDCHSDEPPKQDPDIEVRKIPRFGPKAPAFQYFKTDSNFA